MKLKCKRVGGVIKGIFIMTVLVLIASQVSAYSPEQQTIVEGLNLSDQLWVAHENAIQKQDVSGYNNLVDVYNAWIRQNFGEGAAALLKEKITTANLPGVSQKQQKPTGPYVMKNPFKPGSELSKFGKQEIRGDFYTFDWWNHTFNRIRWLREEPAPLGAKPQYREYLEPGGVYR